MENKRKVVPTWISVILLVLAVFGVGYYGYSLIQIIPYAGWSLFTLSCITSIAGSILAIVYCLTGYKKSSAGIFKAFCASITVSMMIGVYYLSFGMAEDGILYAIRFFDMMIQCGIWFVLMIARDVGKKKSLCLCGTLILLQVIITFINASYGLQAIISSSIGIVTCIITYIMFYGKYQDKEARGAK